MQPPISPILFSVLLFLGMLTMLEVGRRVSIRQDRAEPNANKDRLGTIEAAMLALFGLLIAVHILGSGVAVSGEAHADRRGSQCD
jgi:hypothetical protein